MSFQYYKRNTANYTGSRHHYDETYCNQKQFIPSNCPIPVYETNECGYRSLTDNESERCSCNCSCASSCCSRRRRVPMAKSMDRCPLITLEDIDDIKTCFQEVDRDCDGWINAEELYRFMQLRGTPIGCFNAETLVYYADTEYHYSINRNQLIYLAGKYGVSTECSVKLTEQEYNFALCSLRTPEVENYNQFAYNYLYQRNRKHFRGTVNYFEDQAEKEYEERSRSRSKSRSRNRNCRKTRSEDCYKTDTSCGSELEYSPPKRTLINGNNERFIRNSNRKEQQRSTYTSESEYHSDKYLDFDRLKKNWEERIEKEYNIRRSQENFRNLHRDNYGSRQSFAGSKEFCGRPNGIQSAISLSRQNENYGNSKTKMTGNNSSKSALPSRKESKKSKTNISSSTSALTVTESESSVKSNESQNKKSQKGKKSKKTKSKKSLKPSRTKLTKLKSKRSRKEMESNASLKSNTSINKIMVGNKSQDTDKSESSSKYNVQRNSNSSLKSNTSEKFINKNKQTKNSKSSSKSKANILLRSKSENSIHTNKNSKKSFFGKSSKSELMSSSNIPKEDFGNAMGDSLLSSRNSKNSAKSSKKKSKKIKSQKSVKGSKSNVTIKASDIADDISEPNSPTSAEISDNRESYAEIEPEPIRKSTMTLRLNPNQNSKPKSIGSSKSELLTPRKSNKHKFSSAKSFTSTREFRSEPPDDEAFVKFKTSKEFRPSQSKTSGMTQWEFAQNQNSIPMSRTSGDLSPTTAKSLPNFATGSNANRREDTISSGVSVENIEDQAIVGTATSIFSGHPGSSKTKKKVRFKDGKSRSRSRSRNQNSINRTGLSSRMTM